MSYIHVNKKNRFTFIKKNKKRAYEKLNQYNHSNYKGDEEFFFLINIFPYTSHGIIVCELIKEITVVASYKIRLMNDQSEISGVI